MIDLHFICPHGRNRRDLGDGRFESGFWANIREDRANEAIGGRIYLHERQNERSWQGGTIEDWRSHDAGKKIFIYREDGDQHVLCLEGWGQEQATVRRGDDTAGGQMFWLTYKPLEPGSTKGWPREKLSVLVREFGSDPNATTEWWRLSAHRIARVGDGVVLFKQGEEPRGIFGRGVIVSGPMIRADGGGDDGEKWRVEVRFTELVDPDDTLILPLNELDRALSLERNNLVNTQASGNRVPPAIAFELTALLDARTAPLRTLANDDADDGRPDVFDTFDQRDRALRAICVRRGQTAFRTALMEAYGGRCAITGCRVASVLEAAHIVPYNGPTTNNATNGLLLRSDLHTLYDLNLLGIDPKTRTVVIAKSLEGSSYAKLAGRKLRDAEPIERGASRRNLEHRFRNLDAS